MKYFGIFHKNRVFGDELSKAYSKSLIHLIDRAKLFTPVENGGNERNGVRQKCFNRVSPLLLFLLNVDRVEFDNNEHFASHCERPSKCLALASLTNFGVQLSIPYRGGAIEARS